MPAGHKKERLQTRCSRSCSPARTPHSVGATLLPAELAALLLAALLAALLLGARLAALLATAELTALLLGALLAALLATAELTALLLGALLPAELAALLLGSLLAALLLSSRLLLQAHRLGLLLRSLLHRHRDLRRLLLLLPASLLPASLLLRSGLLLAGLLRSGLLLAGLLSSLLALLALLTRALCVGHEGHRRHQERAAGAGEHLSQARKPARPSPHLVLPVAIYLSYRSRHHAKRIQQSSHYTLTLQPNAISTAPNSRTPVVEHVNNSPAPEGRGRR